MVIENIALFDLDGTLCDYDKSLSEKLEMLRFTNEPVFKLPLRDDIPSYIKERADLIRASEKWWEELPKFRLGWDILEVARELEYRIVILTQGPRRNPASWSGKKKWIDKNLGSDVDITMTRDKGLVYGKVLVESALDSVERTIDTLRREVILAEAIESRDAEQIIKLLKLTYEGSQKIGSIYIASSEGVLQAVYPYGLTLAKDVSDEDFFSKAKQSNKLAMTSLIVSGAIYDKDSNFTGLVAATIDMPQMGNSLLQVAKSDRGEYFVVFDGNMKRIYDPQRNLIGKEMDVLGDSVRGLESYAGGKSQIGYDHNGNEVYQSIRQIEKAGWYIAIQAPISRILQPTRNLSIALFLAVVASVVAAGTLLVIKERRQE